MDSDSDREYEKEFRLEKLHIKLQRCRLADEALARQFSRNYTDNSSGTFHYSPQRMALQATPQPNSMDTDMTEYDVCDGQRLEDKEVFPVSRSSSAVTPLTGVLNKENSEFGSYSVTTDTSKGVTPTGTASKKRKVEFDTDNLHGKLVPHNNPMKTETPEPSRNPQRIRKAARKLTEDLVSHNTIKSELMLEGTPNARHSNRVRKPVNLDIQDAKEDNLQEIKAENKPWSQFTPKGLAVRRGKDVKKLAKTKTGLGVRAYIKKAMTKDTQHKEFCQACREGGLLLCCNNCNKAYHFLCLNPPILEVPDAGWLCLYCSVDPIEFKVHRVINWRWVDSKKERIKYAKMSPEKRMLHAKPVKEYFVQFTGLSHWQCLWISQQQMKCYHPTMLAVHTRNLECQDYDFEPAVYPGDESDPLYERYYKYGVRPEWLQAQRVIDRRRSDDPQDVADHYLVKWRCLPYTECTWEHELTADIEGFEKYQTIYNERKLAFNSKVAKNHSFRYVWIPPTRPTTKVTVPYAGQPEFVDTEKGLRLHNYQMEALNWLRKAWSEGVNTILGDEMGLGKTIQAITFLYSLYKEGHTSGPFLVSVPLSTVLNWEREFELWAPDLYVVTYNGPHPNRAIIRCNEFSFTKNAVRGGRVASAVRGRVAFDVLLVSYEMMSIDLPCLSSISWAALVVDEAHRLKNQDAKFFREVSRYRTDYKLLLTGTPLQNNLGELFNMLRFLSPDDYEEMNALQEKLEDENGSKNLGNAQAIQQLQSLLQKHMLRRVKDDVLDNLPNKTEYIVKVELAPLQKAYYKHILTKNFEALNSPLGGRWATLMAIFVDLQKCCDHPYLFSKAMMEAPVLPNGNYETKALVEASGKLGLLDKMLRALKSGGHRVLIFSHYTRMLDILEDYLNEKGYMFERIDGTITGSLRQDAIDRYNDPGAKQFVFLLSTKAGGLGINLATADTVILYDSDWNPHNDIQALSRAHRIGQKKTVMIYRFITRNSMEERVAQVARSKLILTDLVLEGNGVPNAPMSKLHLQEFIRFGTQGLFQDDKYVRDDFNEEAIRDLLDRSKAAIDKKTNVTDTSSPDFLSSVKVLSYTVDSKDQKNEMESSTSKRESVAPDYWEKLMGDHCQRKVEEHIPPGCLGKGQRKKNVINYNDYVNADDDDLLTSDEESGSDI